VTLRQHAVVYRLQEAPSTRVWTLMPSVLTQLLVATLRLSNRYTSGASYPSPCVLGVHVWAPRLIVDINRPVSRRSKLKSSKFLMIEQINPSKFFHPEDNFIQHRGRKPPSRCPLSRVMTLLSLALLILYSFPAMEKTVH